MHDIRRINLSHEIPAVDTVNNRYLKIRLYRSRGIFNAYELFLLRHKVRVHFQRRGHLLHQRALNSRKIIGLAYIYCSEFFKSRIFFYVFRFARVVKLVVNHRLIKTLEPREIKSVEPAFAYHLVGALLKLVVPFL